MTVRYTLNKDGKLVVDALGELVRFGDLEQEARAARRGHGRREARPGRGPRARREAHAGDHRRGRDRRRQASRAARRPLEGSRERAGGARRGATSRAHARRDDRLDPRSRAQRGAAAAGDLERTDRGDRARARRGAREGDRGQANAVKCTFVDLPGGGSAIVCGGSRYQAKTCSCGKRATRLCDWILPARQQQAISIEILTLKTCDEPLCPGCSTSPEPGKDLCRPHASEWRSDPRNSQRELELSPSAHGSASTSTS